MRRRKLLGAVGLGATGMTGLLGNGTTSAGQDTETSTTTTAAGDEFTGIDSAADRPFARISVGSRQGVQNPENNRAHLIRVWNDSDESRTIGLTLTRGSGGAGSGGDGGPLLDRQFEFPADGYLTLRLFEPASYRLRVRTGDGTPAEIEVPRARFDCNDSWTDVAVAPQGRVKSETVTTEVGCPPEVVSRSFTQLRGACGSANRANVSFDEESVTVRGSIQVPNPCYGARLADVSVTGEDTLRVTVATTEPKAGICTQCLAHVEYRADLAFRDRVPGTVSVVHRADGETKTVARVTRGGGATTTAGGETAETTGERKTDETTTGTTTDT